MKSRFLSLATLLLLGGALQAAPVFEMPSNENLLPSESVVSFLNEMNNLKDGSLTTPYKRIQVMEKKGYNINQYGQNLLARADMRDFWETGIDLFYYANFDNKNLLLKKMTDFLEANVRAKEIQLQNSLTRSMFIINELFSAPDNVEAQKISQSELQRFRHFVVQNDLLNKNVWLQYFGYDTLTYTSAEKVMAVPYENEAEKKKAVEEYKKSKNAEVMVDDMLFILMKLYYLTDDAELLGYIDRTVRASDYPVLKQIYEFATSDGYYQSLRSGQKVTPVK